MTVTKETTLKEVLAIEGAQEILAKYQVPCLMCPRAQEEMNFLTIGAIAENYSLDINGLIEELNKL